MSDYVKKNNILNFFDEYQNIIIKCIRQNLKTKTIISKIYKQELIKYIKKGIVPKVNELQTIERFINYTKHLKGNFFENIWNDDSEEEDYDEDGNDIINP